MVYDDAIGQVVHQTHQEHKDDQPEKEMVVCRADTVVQPLAVVIKLVYAPIAGTTVLGCLLYGRVADLTLEIKLARIKMLPI